MTNPLQLFTTRASRFTNSDGTLTREAIRTFEVLFDRVGGYTSQSTSDLAQMDDDDSGLEEFKHEFGKALEGFGMRPEPVFFEVQQLQSEVSELRELVAVLMQQINDLKQGTYL